MLNILMLGCIPPPYGGVSVHVENLCRELTKMDNIYLLADRPLDKIKSNIYDGYTVYRPLVTVPNTNAPISIRDFFETTLLNVRGYGFDCVKSWGEHLLQSPIFIYYGLRTEIEMLYALPLHEILNTRNVDVIHAHHACSRAYRALLACRLVKKRLPLVVTLHRGEFESRKKKQNNLVKLVLKKADKLIAVSNLVKQLAVNFSASTDRIVVIPNGVNTNLFSPLKSAGLKARYGIEEDETLILFVGALTESKGVSDLIASFKKVKRKNDRLLLVGGGPLEKKLRNLATSLKLQDSVVFMGVIPHWKIAEIYNLADIFVLPSYIEGLSSSLLEAMSCGKPTLTTYPSHSFRHDAVINGFNGLLVRAGDLDALSSSLRLLVDDVKLRRKLGENARKTAREKFDWSIIASKIHKLYEETINQYRNKT